MIPSWTLNNNSIYCVVQAIETSYAMYVREARIHAWTGKVNIPVVALLVKFKCFFSRCHTFSVFMDNPATLFSRCFFAWSREKSDTRLSVVVGNIQLSLASLRQLTWLNISVRMHRKKSWSSVSPWTITRENPSVISNFQTLNRAEKCQKTGTFERRNYKIVICFSAVHYVR